MKNNKTILTVIISILICSLVTSCGVGKKLKGLHKPVDLRNSPLDPDERARKNIEEGRGVSLGGLGGNKSTTYEFSTSNPMWRASLEVLDFIPLSTVDYSGGMIITDWYSDGADTGQEAIKISVRFLSNEIRSDSLKIIVHRKICLASENCKVNLLPGNSKIKSELLSVILRKASLLQKSSKKK